MKTVLVRALENGHDGTRYRFAGEVFAIAESRLTTPNPWFVLNDKAPPPPPVPDNIGAGPKRKGS